MRAWQPVIGVFLGFLLGKILSMAIYWLPGFVLGAGSLATSANRNFSVTVLATLVLALVAAVAGAIWFFVNFFILSSWLPKAAGASAGLSAVMVLYTIGIVFICGTLGWFGAICAPPFWVHGWF